MTKNTKIILGVGAVAIALYLYNKNKKSKSVTSDVVTPPTGGGSLSPAPVPMPTPIPDLPQAEGGSEVFYCKDGTRVTRKKSTGATTMQFIDPCKANGGIDYPKTKKNLGESKARGGALSEGSPCVHNEFLAGKTVMGREGGENIIKSAGIIKNGVCVKVNAPKTKQCPQGQKAIQPQCITTPCNPICVSI